MEGDEVMPHKRVPAKLALADGTVVSGWAIGRLGEAAGELCFNTSMTGYQEIFTDPSYYGQLMMMSYPHIGNYGVTEEHSEAPRPMVQGVIVRAFSYVYSNPHADTSLDEWLDRHGIVGITGVDTRMLVRLLRHKGAMNAVISSVDLDNESLVEKARRWPSMQGLELASRVSTPDPYELPSDGPFRVAVYDYGVKRSILEQLRSRGCTLRVFPARTPVEAVLAWNPDGVFFSNGPGDPNAMPYAIQTVRFFLEQTDLPLFGICLGHQLMALASGCTVYKMHTGHRGANHPVKNLQTGRVEITTQNHGFAVAADSIDPTVARISHLNLNDHTVEGLEFVGRNAFCVQYHPEACPGPHDSRYLFDEFRARLEVYVTQKVAC
jgi:carbamoyl-phosphate synthase small subunit